jgi:hypothetical protein
MIFVAHATIAEAIKDHEKLEKKKRKKHEQEEEEKGVASEGKLEVALGMTLP